MPINTTNTDETENNSELEYLKQKGTITQAMVDYVKSNNKKFSDSFYREMIPKIIEKIHNRFKSNESFDTLAFIKIIQKIIFQHYGKRAKEMNRTISEKDQDLFFIYMIHHLYKKELISGDYIDLVVTKVLITMEEIEDTKQLKINKKSILKSLEEALEEKKSSQLFFNFHIFLDLK